MARRQGQGNRSGGGNLQLWVTGPRNAVTARVRFVQGSNPQQGKVVTVFIGNEQDPFARDLGITFPIEANGLGSTSLDLTGYRATDYTRLTIQVEGRTADATLPAATGSGNAFGTRGRFEISPAGAEIIGTSHNYDLIIKTRDSAGNSVGRKVSVSADEPVQLVNKQSGTVIVSATTYHDLSTGTGVLHLRINMAGDQRLTRQISITDSDTGQTVDKTLKFR